MKCHFSPVRQKFKSLTVLSTGRHSYKTLLSTAVRIQDSTAPLEGNLPISNKTTSPFNAKVPPLGIYSDNTAPV